MLKFRFQIGFYLIFGMANLIVLRFLKLPFDVKEEAIQFRSTSVPHLHWEA